MLFETNNPTNTENFKIIDLIFAHLTFYAIQDSSNQTTLNENRDSVFRAISIDVIAYNIVECILHSLLKLFVETSFNNFNENNLIKLLNCWSLMKILWKNSISCITSIFVCVLFWRDLIICLITWTFYCVMISRCCFLLMTSRCTQKFSDFRR